MRKWALRKEVVCGVAVLGVMTLMVSAFLLYSGGVAGLAQGLPQVEMSLAAQPVGGGVVGYSLLLVNHEVYEETLDEIRFFLPQGQKYVGLTAGSEVGEEPSVSQGALTWAGPFTIPGGESLSLRFWAVAVKEGASGLSRGAAYVGGAEVASAEAEVYPGYRPPLAAVPTPPVGRVGAASTSITVTKSVSPESTSPFRSVKYTAIFSNSTESDVALSVITDTFSSNQVFHVGAAWGSDIGDPDELSNPVAVWTGPYTVTAYDTLTLAYWAWVGDVFGEETVANTLQAEVEDGSVGPVTETLDIEVEQVFFPLAMKELSLVSPASLEDHFDANADNWTPFLNYWRLSADQWYWAAGAGYTGGGYRHDRYAAAGKEAEDALSMYLVEGAQEWTDYTFQARVIIRAGQKAGLWFRGTYPSDDAAGGNVGGYYMMMGGGGVSLLQMQTEDDCEGAACTNTQNLWDFNNPRPLTSVSRSINTGTWHLLKVEVQGANIKCYLDGELLINYDDSPIPGDGIKNDTVFSNGTVGFKVYKCGNVVFDDVLVTPL